MTSAPSVKIPERQVNYYDVAGKAMALDDTTERSETPGLDD